MSDSLVEENQERSVRTSHLTFITTDDYTVAPVRPRLVLFKAALVTLWVHLDSLI